MSSNDINRKSIAVIQLQHDIASKSLKTRAISEVLAKVLYQNSKQSLSINRLVLKASGLTGLTQIPIDITEEGLKWLKENNWADEVSGKWFLTEEGKVKVSSRHTESERSVASVLQKHFALDIDHTTLKPWFLEAATLFFSEFGEVISRALLRETVSLPNHSDLKSILIKSIEKAGLEEKKEFLITGFYGFLNDIDPKMEAQKMSFALATLSARLIAASAGPDPLSLPEFENSKLFLDTNVLLLEKIEIRNGETSLALVALAKALKSIGAELCIIKHTKEEYERVVNRKRIETLKALKSGVSISVFEKSNDSFLKTAVKSMARNELDFIRFFDSITEAPKSIGPVEITLLENHELQVAIDQGVKDVKKKNEISTEWEKIRDSKKSVPLVEHDAALNAAVLFYKKNKGKAWVITRDKSMLNLSKRWHEHEGLPAWVYLEALVEILAVYGAGPKYKPEEFAPLLGALIRSDVQDTFANFQVEDLGELADIDSRAFELTDVEVISYAEKLHRMKLSGEKGDSSDLQLHMRRTFQGRRMADNKEAEKAQAELKRRMEKIELTKDIGIAALSKQILPRVRWKRRRFWLVYLALAIILSLILYKNWYNEAWRVSLIIAIIVDILIPVIIHFVTVEKNSPEEEAKVMALKIWESEKNN